MPREGPEGPEFAKSPVVIGANGGGAGGHVEGSPSDSIAIDSECPIATFGYNSKDPMSIRHKHQREEHNGR
jgi:hypothetical protein